MQYSETSSLYFVALKILCPTSSATSTLCPTSSATSTLCPTSSGHSIIIDFHVGGMIPGPSIFLYMNMPRVSVQTESVLTIEHNRITVSISNDDVILPVDLSSDLK
ncbi:hypothetical protein TNCV_1297091 [Trichonephila clavipes]|nr:hypothetical protein TNCV_1297091 [Trichonephila clavipes]